jgi:hypothetical protein
MSQSEGHLSPKDVIESIRKDDFEIDESRPKKFSFKDKLIGRQAKLLAEDLYSEENHFILELVQNADDNDYEKGSTPTLSFLLEPDCLIVRNNERGFTERNVRALCNMGDSSKAKKSGFIGEKGIGFKSVFSVSDTPEIHSNGYHFYFDRTDKSNPLGHVLPHWIAKPRSGLDSKFTTIVLPTRPSEKFKPERLSHIDEKLLLYLGKLRRLELHAPVGSKIFRRTERDGVSILNSEFQKKDHKAVVTESRFLRVAHPVSMKDIEEEKREGIDDSEVILAFPINEKGQPIHKTGYPTYAYLPIRAYGFRFCIQADFLLSSGREDIHTEREWNLRLRDQIAPAFVGALDRFKRSEGLAFHYLDYLPKSSEIVDEFFEPIEEQIVELLSNTESLPGEAGQWRKPSELMRAKEEFRALFSSSDVQILFGKDYLDARFHADAELLSRLGCDPLTYSDLISLFQSHGDWLVKKEKPWLAKFYAYLAQLDIEAFIRFGLNKSPCILTSDGTFKVPSEQTIFLPLSARKKYGFEDELRFIDEDLLELANEQSNQVPIFFASLELKTADPYQLITNHILPRHKGEAWKHSAHKALAGHLRYIKEKIDHYVSYASVLLGGEDKALKSLSDGLWIGTKKSSEVSWTFSRASSLYFSKEFEPPFCIETMLGASIDSGKLVSPQYLLSLSGKTKQIQPDDLLKWRQFLGCLGVSEAPRLLVLPGGDAHCSQELALLLKSEDSRIRRATLECMDRNWSRYTNHLTYPTQPNRQHSPQRYSNFVTVLRETIAPTKQKKSEVLSRCYLPTDQIREMFGDTPVYLDAQVTNHLFLDACEITYEVTVDSCIKRLVQLRENRGKVSVKTLKQIYRRLEELFPKDGERIKQEFENQKLIFLGASTRGWGAISETTWEKNTSYLDSLFPPLQGLYFEHQTFFVRQLGVPKKLSTVKAVEALLSIGRFGSLDERIDEAMRIYKRASNELRLNSTNSSSKRPAWMVTFLGSPVFLDKRGNLHSRNAIFVNDFPRYGSLFEDAESISLFASPTTEIPKLRNLLEEVGARFVSDEMSIEAEIPEERLVNERFTKKIRESVEYLARVVYHTSDATLNNYEEAKANGLFRSLANTDVFDVPLLKFNIELNGVERATDGDICWEDGQIFIRNGAKPLVDLLSRELREHLDAPTVLDEIFSRVLSTDNRSDLEDYLEYKNIGPLPADEIAGLFGANVAGHEDGEGIEALVDDPIGLQDDAGVIDEVEGTDDAGVIDLDLAKSTESEAKARNAEARKAPTTSANHSSKAEKKIEPEVDAIPPVSTNLGGRADRSHQESASQEFDPNQRASDGRKELKSPDEEEAHHSRVDDNSGESGSSDRGSRDRIEGPQSQGDSTDHGHQERPDYKRDQPKPGKSKARYKDKTDRQEKKYKSGRLRSYAEAGDQNHNNDDEEYRKAEVAWKSEVEQAAVAYFRDTEGHRWTDLEIMDHYNPGFDAKGKAPDGQEEFIEIKGQSGAWTEAGVALTRMEISHAMKNKDRHWLCVVEYATDATKRKLFLVKDPYGSVSEFRFDAGWKTAAVVRPLSPAVGLCIDIDGRGSGIIVGIGQKSSSFVKVDVDLDDGETMRNVLFNPSKMKLRKP